MHAAALLYPTENASFASFVGLLHGGPDSLFVCLYFYFFSLSFSLSILFCFAATLDLKRLWNERLIITVRQIFLWSSIFSIDRTYFSWIFGTQKILLNNFWRFYDPICPNNSRKLFDKIDGDQNCVVRCYRSLKCFPRNMGGLWNCNAAACRS